MRKLCTRISCLNKGIILADLTWTDSLTVQDASAAHQTRRSIKTVLLRMKSRRCLPATFLSRCSLYIPVPRGNARNIPSDAFRRKHRQASLDYVEPTIRSSAQLLPSPLQRTRSLSTKIGIANMDQIALDVPLSVSISPVCSFLLRLTSTSQFGQTSTTVVAPMGLHYQIPDSRLRRHLPHVESTRTNNFQFP